MSIWDGTTCPNCKSPRTDNRWYEHEGKIVYRCEECRHSWSKESHGLFCKCPKCKPQVRPKPVVNTYHDLYHSPDCRCVLCQAENVIRRK